MSKTFLQSLILFIALELVQAVVFNNICLFNVAVPFVFIYFIIHLPITLNVNWVLTLAFITGLGIDISANTLGMNALACTLMAMTRRTVLHLYFPREDELSLPEPTMRSLGADVYLKYLFTEVLFYCIVIYLIESFSLFDPLRLVLRIIGSTVLTFALLAGLDSVLSHKR